MEYTLTILFQIPNSRRRIKWRFADKITIDDDMLVRRINGEPVVYPERWTDITLEQKHKYLGHLFPIINKWIIEQKGGRPFYFDEERTFYFDEESIIDSYSFSQTVSQRDGTQHEKYICIDV